MDKTELHPAPPPPPDCKGRFSSRIMFGGGSLSWGRSPNILFFFHKKKVGISYRQFYQCSSAGMEKATSLSSHSNLYLWRRDLKSVHAPNCIPVQASPSLAGVGGGKCAPCSEGNLGTPLYSLLPGTCENWGRADCNPVLCNQIDQPRETGAAEPFLPFAERQRRGVAD